MKTVKNYSLKAISVFFVFIGNRILDIIILLVLCILGAWSLLAPTAEPAKRRR